MTLQRMIKLKCKFDLGKTTMCMYVVLVQAYRSSIYVVATHCTHNHPYLPVASAMNDVFLGHHFLKKQERRLSSAMYMHISCV